MSWTDADTRELQALRRRAAKKGYRLTPADVAFMQRAAAAADAKDASEGNPRSISATSLAAGVLKKEGYLG